MNIEKLSKCGTVRKYEPGSFICIEGDSGNTAFMVLQGSVDVVLGTYKDKRRTVATINAGSIFGEMSLLENAPRSATIMVNATDVIVLEINQDDFLKLMETEPELAFNLLKTLHKRIEDTMENSGRYMVAYNAEVRRNKLYVQISSLTLDQFTVIVGQKDGYALNLLTYLSHTLTLINRELMERVNK